MTSKVNQSYSDCVLFEFARIIDEVQSLINQLSCAELN